MKPVIVGAIVGLVIAGIVAGAIVPMLPVAARQPWVVWTVAAAVVAAAMYVARRCGGLHGTRKTPPG